MLSSLALRAASHLCNRHLAQPSRRLLAIPSTHLAPTLQQHKSKWNIRNFSSNLSEATRLEVLKQAVIRGDSSTIATFNSSDLVTLTRHALKGQQTELFPHLRNALKPSIDSADADSLMLLAGMCMESLGGELDVATAVRCYVKASEQGRPDAMFCLGVLCDTRAPVTREPEAEEEKGFLEPDNVQFDPRSRRIMLPPKTADQIQRAKQAKRVKKDDKEAAKWYAKATKAGHQMAMMKLASMYVEGRGVEKDVSKALHLYEKCAESGNKDALVNLGDLFFSGVETVLERNLEKAADYFQQAAALGDEGANYWMGYAYHQGIGVPQDISQALVFLNKAAELGHPGAMFYLATMYRTGDGVARDQKQMFDWYQKACNEGDADSLFAMAEIFAHGQEEQEQSYARAIPFYTMAGQKRHADALLNLGTLYFHGLGSEQSYEKAFDIYQKAAEAGSIEAIRNLANMHFQGLGITKNEQTAAEFMEVVKAKEEAEKREAMAMDQELQSLQQQGSSASSSSASSTLSASEPSSSSPASSEQQTVESLFREQTPIQTMNQEQK